MPRRGHLSGDKEVIRKMQRLARAPQGRALDAIGADALIPLALETSARAPVAALKTGVVIAKVRGRFSGPRVSEHWVSFKRGIARQIAHLVELGTQPHSMAKGASVRKGLLQDRPPFSPGSAPRPYFRPAFENTKDQVVRRAGAALWRLSVQAIGGKT